MRLSKTILFTFLSFHLFAQVDISKYASDDLFKVNAVVSSTTIDSKSQNAESNFDLELQTGFDFVEKNELDDALDHFLKMDEKYDQIAYLKYYVGLVYFQRSELLESLEYMQEAFRLEPLFLEPLYYISLIHANNKNFKEAKEHINRLIEVHNYTALGYFGKAAITSLQGDYYRAIRMYKKCIEIDSTFLDAYIPLIELEMSVLRDAKSAFIYANQAVGVNSDWEQAIIIRGILAIYLNNDTKQFHSDIEHLVSLDPSNYHYHYLRGFLNVELNEFEKAVNDFKIGLNLELDTVNRGEYKFSTRVKQDKTLRDMINYYSYHYHEYDSMSRTYINKAICSFFEEYDEKAIKFLDSLETTNSIVPEFLLRAAILNSKWGKSKQAIIAFTSAIELDSTIYFAFEERGKLYQTMGYLDSAKSDYSMLIKLNPRNKMGYKHRGFIKLNEKEYFKAYRDFSIGLAIDTTDYDLYFNRATSSFYMGKFKNSLFDIEKVIRDKKDDFEAYYMSYLCHLNIGDSAQAVICLDSASSLGKYEDDYHKELISFGQVLNDGQLQIKGWSRLVKYRSRNKGYRLERAKVYIDEDLFDEALADIKHYLKYEKKSGEGYYLLSVVHGHLGNQKDSMRYLEKSKKMGFSVD